MVRSKREPLTEAQRRQRAIIAAIAAGLIILIAVVGIVIASVLAPGEGDAAPSGETSSANPPPPAFPVGDVVDPTVTELGWLPQPITDDPRAYGEAAAVALATYDTTLALREDFIDYLATWHTADYRFAIESEREEVRVSQIGVIGERMIPGVEAWKEQALTKTIRTATVVGAKLDKEHLTLASASFVDQYIAEGQHIVTTEIVVTTSAEDRSTGERFQFEERFNITARIMCGNSFPPSGSGQAASSCMLLNYINEPFI